MIVNKTIEEGVLCQFNGSRNLLVSFGGIKMGLGMPVFEFYNTLKGIDCDKIFIKDINQSWYHKGINHELSGINDIKVYLKNKISSSKYENVCFIGNSMGGFAALLFGVLLNVSNILAFSPQTFIDKERRFFYRDNRWKNEINQVYTIPKKNLKVFDLKKHLVKHKFIFNGKIKVFYSTNDRLDKIHAERLKKTKCLELFPFSHGGHQLVRHLKESGDLEKIFRNIFQNE